MRLTEIFMSSGTYLHRFMPDSRKDAVAVAFLMSTFSMVSATSWQMLQGVASWAITAVARTATIAINELSLKDNILRRRQV